MPKSRRVVCMRKNRKSRKNQRKARKGRKNRTLRGGASLASWFMGKGPAFPPVNTGQMATRMPIQPIRVGASPSTWTPKAPPAIQPVQPPRPPPAFQPPRPPPAVQPPVPQPGGNTIMIPRGAQVPPMNSPAFASFKQFLASPNYQQMLARATPGSLVPYTLK